MSDITDSIGLIPQEHQDGDKIIKPIRVYPRGYHPNSLHNLLPPLKKGDNGGFNRAGYSLTAELKQAIRARRHELIASTIEGAIRREPVAFREVWDRLEGKLTDNTIAIRDINVVFVIGKGYEETNMSQVTCTIEGEAKELE